MEVLNRQVTYFVEDEELDEALAKLKAKNDFKYHKEDVYFSLCVYIEILVIHIISFALIGPLINIYPPLICKNWYYMKNLLFLQFTPMGI